MQLFISPSYHKQNTTIIIHDERIIHQCFHVLRYKPWQILQLQDNWIRYTLSITHISKKEIQTTIYKEETIVSPSITTVSPSITIACALPNRRDKAELIVQKLTEIGIENIILRKAERSILRDMPNKKLQRLQSIACEATEQSFGRTVPTITYLDNLFESTILSSGQIVLFHQDWIPANQLKISNSKFITSIVGPEWWFSDTELKKLSTLPNCITINLWDTILRMETAAIIWSRLLRNNC
jgi:16S rRNA (uracil1498-N3)-methyltransferase